MMNNLLAGPNLSSALEPVYDILSVLLPIVLGLLFVFGAFKCIALGVAFAKSDENGTHEKAKKDLSHAIIGFLIPFVLIAVLYFVRVPLLEWISSITESMPLDENFIRIINA